MRAAGGADHDDLTVRLAPRLVPRSLWGLSGHRKLPRSQWRAIRAEILEEAGGRCRLCGESRESGMICDEVWEYDPDKGIARLTGLQIVCPPCNAVVHIGQAIARLGPKIRDDAIERMAQINGTSVEEAREEISLGFLRWSRLSAVPVWRIDIVEAVRGRFPMLQSIHGLVSGDADEEGESGSERPTR